MRRNIAALLVILVALGIVFVGLHLVRKWTRLRDFKRHCALQREAFGHITDAKYATLDRYGPESFSLQSAQIEQLASILHNGRVWGPRMTGGGWESIAIHAREEWFYIRPWHPDEWNTYQVGGVVYVNEDMGAFIAGLRKQITPCIRELAQEQHPDVFTRITWFKYAPWKGNRTLDEHDDEIVAELRDALFAARVATGSRGPQTDEITVHTGRDLFIIYVRRTESGYRYSIMGSAYEGEALDALMSKLRKRCDEARNGPKGSVK